MIPLNRTMSLDDFDDVRFREAADFLIYSWFLAKRIGGQCSTWWGTLDDKHVEETALNKGPGYSRPSWYPEEMDVHIPWFTLWEYCWTLVNSGAMRAKGMRLLSLGGAASVMDFSLLRMGHHIELVEARSYSPAQQVENLRLLECGSLNPHIMSFAQMGMLDIDPCDAMVSTNVIFLSGEEPQRVISKELKRLVRVGGVAAFTFDLGNPNPKRLVTDPISHFKWDGFRPVGEFVDRGDRYHVFYPDVAQGKYTAGSLLQRRV